MHNLVQSIIIGNVRKLHIADSPVAHNHRVRFTNIFPSLSPGSFVAASGSTYPVVLCQCIHTLITTRTKDLTISLCIINLCTVSFVALLLRLVGGCENVGNLDEGFGCFCISWMFLGCYTASGEVWRQALSWCINIDFTFIYSYILATKFVAIGIYM